MSLNQAVKAHNAALRNLKILHEEQKAYPKNVVYRPGNTGGYHPWLPNNYVRRLKNAKRRYAEALNALHNAAGTPKNTERNRSLYRTEGGHTHSGNWRSNLNNNNNNRGSHHVISHRARMARVRNASNAVRGNAATVLQKIWRGRRNRLELTHPKPQPRMNPLLYRALVAMGLKNNNTSRGLALTPNQMKKMNFMLKKYHNV